MISEIVSKNGRRNPRVAFGKRFEARIESTLRMKYEESKPAPKETI